MLALSVGQARSMMLAASCAACLNLPTRTAQKTLPDTFSGSNSAIALQTTQAIIAYRLNRCANERVDSPVLYPILKEHPVTDPRVQKLAKVLIHYSLSIKPGDKVLIQAPANAAPLITEAYRE